MDRKFIDAVNVSRREFIDAFNLSQKLLLIASPGVYESKPQQIVIVNAVCFFLGSLVTGFALSGGLWLLLKHFKKGQGPGWFLNLLYWHLPLHYLQGVIFIKTPPASLRHWLS